MSDSPTKPPTGYAPLAPVESGSEDSGEADTAPAGRPGDDWGPDPGDFIPGQRSKGLPPKQPGDGGSPPGEPGPEAFPVGYPGPGGSPPGQPGPEGQPGPGGFRPGQPPGGFPHGQPGPGQPGPGGFPPGHPGPGGFPPGQGGFPPGHPGPGGFPPGHPGPGGFPPGQPGPGGFPPGQPGPGEFRPGQPPGGFPPGQPGPGGFPPGHPGPGGFPPGHPGGYPPGPGGYPPGPNGPGAGGQPNWAPPGGHMAGYPGPAPGQPGGYGGPMGPRQPYGGPGHGYPGQPGQGQPYGPPGGGPRGYGSPYHPSAQLGPGMVRFHAGGPADGSMPGGQAWQPGQGTPHKWDNLPDKPLDDDPNRGPPQFGPPPLPPGMQQWAGYEGMGGAFGQFVPLPAPPSLPPPPGEPPKMEFDEVARLTVDQCTEALVEYAAQQCCYGSACAKDHLIKKIQPSTALHYTLETYSEGRSTGYQYEPYRGGPVDGPENGQPSLPWEIPCNADELFVDQAKLIEVPHTAEIQECHGCDGRGFNRCWRCHGLGRVRCSHCHGDGRVTRHDPERGEYQDSCNFCGGDGWRRCITCSGDGRVKCHECEGYRKIKCFIQLTVQYTNHKDDYILEETDMPDELVRNVEGTSVFEQALPQVWPIVAYHVQEVNASSQRLVEEHRVGFTNERQLHQRQILRAVPVTEVHYTWKDTESRYWVYGREKQIYCPDYPQTCCWGCQIL